jgi:O-acetyl-ADP-ribose deacetylase (regulator of RNase III)
MIHEVSGDILLTKAQSIAHSVAPNDCFDEGLRLALREKWPMLAKDFRRYAEQCHPKPGEIWAWDGAGIRVFNLLTLEDNQGAKSGKATTASVDHCLRRLRYELDKGDIKSIALPRLATGQGGLEWSEVLSLIRSNLGDLKIPVYVYSDYHQGVQATETGV